MYDFSVNVILPYTIFLIVAENFEEKNGGNIIKDMWETFNIFFEDLNNKDITTNFDSFKNQIACLSNHVNEIFWKFIDEQIDVYAKEPYIHDSNIQRCLDEIDKLRDRKVVDEKAANIIRDLEVLVNEFKCDRKKDEYYE